MGYSRNPATLLKLRPILTELEAGRTCHWRTDSDPFRLAYKIREALYIAKLYPARFPALAAAADHFTLRVVDKSVEAIPKSYAQPLDGQMMIGEKDQPSTEPVVFSRFFEGNGGQTAMSIIQAWHEAQPSQGALHWPNAHLTKDELIKLYNWTQEIHWLMFEADGGLTLKPWDDELATYAWSPEDLE